MQYFAMFLLENYKLLTINLSYKEVWMKKVKQITTKQTHECLKTLNKKKDDARTHLKEGIVASHPILAALHNLSKLKLLQRVIRFKKLKASPIQIL